MRFQGTLVLFALCLGLGAFLYFYEYRGGAEREKAKEEENRLWNVDAGDIRQLELTSAGETLTLDRVDDKGWIISAPRRLSADGDEADRIASAAAGIRREATVEAEASDLSRYGLEPPEQVLRFATQDGKRHAIRFGGKNPAGSSTYAVLEEGKEVFLVGGHVAGGFAKKLDDFRNRAVLNFDQYDTHMLEIRSAKGTLKLAKEGDRWWLEGDQRHAAETSQVASMLGALANGRVEEFFEENPAAYPDLGFAAPLLQVKLAVGKDRAFKQLAVGLEKTKLQRPAGRPAQGQPGKETEGTAEAGREVFLARDASREELFFVSRELVDQLSKTVEELRDKSLALFQRWEIDEVVLSNSTGTVKFAKSETGADWLVGEQRKKARWDAVSGILDLLQKPVLRFIDRPEEPAAYGLEKPAARVVLKKAGVVQADLSLGRRTGEGVYARLEGERTVRVAAAEVLEGLSRGEAEFLEPEAETEKKEAGPAKK